MLVKDFEKLEAFCATILTASGASQSNADCVAEHLVDSHLSGVDTHGVCHLPLYVKAIADGQILPAADPRIMEEGSTHALVSGGWTFGHVGARLAMEVAIGKAKQAKIAAVSLVQVHHIGRLGHYVEMATAEGLIAIVAGGGYCHEKPRAAPYGGKEGALDTNPVAIGMPTGGEDPWPTMFDFATTTLSGVKVKRAQDTGEPLPPDAILDKDGKPTTNASDYFDGGTFRPFGSHKGYALMVTAEYLGRIFSGADRYLDPPHGGPIFGHQGVTMIVFRADLFQLADEFKISADQTRRRIRAVPPAPGFDRVLMPGDMEGHARAARKEQGIEVPDDLWKSIGETAKSLGVEVG